MPQIKQSNFDKSVQKDARSVSDGEKPQELLCPLAAIYWTCFIASIAYVDPGTLPPIFSAGAQLGYTLLWVIILSNLFAMVIQSLSAKLGIATGKNLAEHCRESLPKWLVWGMWVLMELIAMATDLAEFLGAAVGLNLLLGIPLWLAGILTAIATYLILDWNVWLSPHRSGNSHLRGRDRGGLHRRDYHQQTVLGSRGNGRAHPPAPIPPGHPAGYRHPGRHGDAPCHFSAFRTHPKSHYCPTAEIPETAFPL